MSQRVTKGSEAVTGFTIHELRPPSCKLQSRSSESKSFETHESDALTMAILSPPLLLWALQSLITVTAFEPFRMTRFSASSRNGHSFSRTKTPASLLRVASDASDISEIPEISGDDDQGKPSQHMGAWVPVGSISCWKGLDPIDIEIMGNKFAVWKSAAASWSVLVDECSHRMAPLSLGRIDPVTKCLECPYHGWQFDRNGTLQRIPQLEKPANLQADSRSVEAFPVHTTGDLLWVFLPTSFHGESFPQSMLPEEYYHGLGDFCGRGVTFFTQDLPFSYDFLVEK